MSKPAIVATSPVWGIILDIHTDNPKLTANELVQRVDQAIGLESDAWLAVRRESPNKTDAGIVGGYIHHVRKAAGQCKARWYAQDWCRCA